MALLLPILGIGRAEAQPQRVPATAAPAAAGAEAKPAGSRFADLLGGLTWDMSHEAVADHFAAESLERFNARKKSVADSIEIERMRRRMEDDIATLRGNYTKFVPGEDAYRVSIVEGEYATGTGEAVFRVDDAEAQRYFFFINDRLWKIFVAYNLGTVRTRPFPAALREMAERYGKFDEVRREKRRVKKTEEEVLAAVIWQDETVRVRMEDRGPFFGTYVMVVSSRAIEDRIAELRGQFGLSAAPDDGVDPGVRSLVGDIEGDGASGGDEDIVDSIIGSETRVDVVQEVPISEDDFQPVKPQPQPQAQPGPAPAPKDGPGGLGDDPDSPIIY